MPDQPAKITERIAEILYNHRWYRNNDQPAFGRCACDWLGDGGLEVNWREHPTHVAEVLVAELGLTREQRTLADGMGGATTNYKTGETTVHSRPCTRQSRYVTQWQEL